MPQKSRNMGSGTQKQGPPGGPTHKKWDTGRSSTQKMGRKEVQHTKNETKGGMLWIDALVHTCNKIAPRRHCATTTDKPPSKSESHACGLGMGGVTQSTGN